MKISNLEDCPSDIEAVANWYFHEWDYKNSESSLESVVKKISSFANRNSFVVHIDGKLAGAGEIKYRKYSSYPGFNHWLDGIYVPFEYRGQGISKALIEFSKAKALTLKIPSLYLRCEEHLVQLYENHGFRVVCTEETKFIMVLRISPNP
ncbi:GNAT family N-acetyltransferase [Photobacterium sp. GJ3]|uniref:GNAT family N-acetyltransferase n=1 Tax=Photobacterium sp. GJ3 TaxID=2829502 RepID=UPI001B8CED9A|nr:GNAT family N-acetyltransferase [Photobacterium sp. GJ3]QUJ66233.1 GNAT family N-acetyltransferase [Photobacterium sp. GJ3]